MKIGHLFWQAHSGHETTATNQRLLRDRELVQMCEQPGLLGSQLRARTTSFQLRATAPNPLMLRGWGSAGAPSG